MGHPNKSWKWGQQQEKVAEDALTCCCVLLILVVSTSGVRRRSHEKEPVDRNFTIQPPSKPISSGLWASQVACKLPAYKCVVFFPPSSRLGQARDNKAGREAVQQGFALAQTTNCSCGRARDETARTREAPRKHLLCAGFAHQKVRVSKQGRHAVELVCEKEIHPHSVISTPDKIRANYHSPTFCLSLRPACFPSDW